MAQNHLWQDIVISLAKRDGDEIEGMGVSLGINTLELSILIKKSLSL